MGTQMKSLQTFNDISQTLLIIIRDYISVISENCANIQHISYKYNIDYIINYLFAFKKCFDFKRIGFTTRSNL